MCGIFVNFFFLSLYFNIFDLCTSLQSHYAQQARRSRSQVKKRKREESVQPTSRTRSQSASKQPRDQSGIRDAKVRHRVSLFILIIFASQKVFFLEMLSD